MLHCLIYSEVSLLKVDGSNSWGGTSKADKEKKDDPSLQSSEMEKSDFTEHRVCTFDIV